MPADIFPPIAIILLNYNGAEDTIECLESLRAITYPNYKIIIVDNASSDNSMERTKDYLQSQNLEHDVFNSPGEAMAHPMTETGYTVLQSGYNGGYGYGNNIGIRYALKQGAEYVLLLNNDTVVDSGFLEPLVKMYEAGPDTGIVSGEIYFYDKPGKIWFKGGQIHPRTLEITSTSFKEKEDEQHSPEGKSFVSGCMWLISRKVIEKVGLIREDFFLYMEDLDYCLRVQENGFRLSVCSESRIFHKIGARPGGKIRKTVLYWRGRNLRILLGERLGNRIRESFASVAYLIKILLRLWKNGQVFDIRYVFKGIKDGRLIREMRANLVLIGVHKAGTTSLFDSLVSHPDIGRGKRKEIHFFTPLRYGRNMKSLRYYVNQFPKQSKVSYQLDASPSYFYGGMEIAQAIRLTLGKPKLILVLRDPVERLISFYRFLKGTVRLKRDTQFAEFIERSIVFSNAEDQDEVYHRAVREGCYGDYLGDWIRIFDTDLRVVFFDDILQQPDALLSDLAQWLGIDPDLFPDIGTAIAHSNRTRLPKSDRLHLVALDVNRWMDQLIRRFPRVKDVITSTYYAINEGDDIEIIDVELKDRLKKYYEKSNKQVRQLLMEAGYSRLPDWLRGP